MREKMNKVGKLGLTFGEGFGILTKLSDSAAPDVSRLKSLKKDKKVVDK